MKESGKKILMICTVITLIALNSCSDPSLCDCLKAKGGDPCSDKPSGCKKVFKERYGRCDPSLDQMREDYYNCK